LRKVGDWVLKLEDVSSGYGFGFSLERISFEVYSGERLCIIGPNGCGKSTLLKTIANLLDYTGEIFLGTKKLKDYNRKDLAKKIAYMSQITSIYFPYTVFETVMLGRYSRMKSNFFKTESKEDIAFVEECLEIVNITKFKDKSITDLSGGELQRVFLAKVFAQEPDVILLDEPTNHLDIKHQIELMEYLKKWSKDTNNIVVAVLHDINLALSFADRFLLMSDGEIVSHGNKDTILNKDDINKVYDTDIKKYMIKSFGLWTQGSA